MSVFTCMYWYPFTPHHDAFFGTSYERSFVVLARWSWAGKMLLATVTVEAGCLAHQYSEAPELLTIPAETRLSIVMANVRQRCRNSEITRQTHLSLDVIDAASKSSERCARQSRARYREVGCMPSP